MQTKYPSHPLAITTNCSNVEIFERKLTRDVVRKNGVFYIGLIGSYNSKYKGIQDALRVIKDFKMKNIQVHLKVLGSGNSLWLFELIKKYDIEDCVSLDGALPAGEEVFKWLEGLDLYIQPSYTEGLPRALIEAMYCQLPCIASNVGGIPELLSKDFIHRPKDVADLYSKIEFMILNETIRKKEGEKNYLIAKEYLKDKLDCKREEFWEKILKDI